MGAESIKKLEEENAKAETEIAKINEGMENCPTTLVGTRARMNTLSTELKTLRDEKTQVMSTLEEKPDDEEAGNRLKELLSLIAPKAEEYSLLEKLEKHQDTYVKNNRIIRKYNAEKESRKALEEQAVHLVESKGEEKDAKAAIEKLVPKYRELTLKSMINDINDVKQQIRKQQVSSEQIQKRIAEYEAEKEREKNELARLRRINPQEYNKEMAKRQQEEDEFNNAIIQKRKQDELDRKQEEEKKAEEESKKSLAQKANEKPKELTPEEKEEAAFQKKTETRKKEAYIAAKPPVLTEKTKAIDGTLSTGDKEQDDKLEDFIQKDAQKVFDTIKGDGKEFMSFGKMDRILTNHFFSLTNTLSGEFFESEMKANEANAGGKSKDQITVSSQAHASKAVNKERRIIAELLYTDYIAHYDNMDVAPYYRERLGKYCDKYCKDYNPLVQNQQKIEENIAEQQKKWDEEDFVEEEVARRRKETEKQGGQFNEAEQRKEIEESRKKVKAETKELTKEEKEAQEKELREANEKAERDEEERMRDVSNRRKAKDAAMSFGEELTKAMYNEGESDEIAELAGQVHDEIKRIIRDKNKNGAQKFSEIKAAMNKYRAAKKQPLETTD